jgi:hypothetical protein
MEEYYVYAYLDPGKMGMFEYGEFSFGYEPFYIGKGKGKRCHNGLNDKKNKIKKSKIEKIYLSSQEPIIVKIKSGLNENEAFELEILLVERIGRIVLKNGPLANITDGGSGTPGRKDTKENLVRKEKFKHSEEWKKILSKPILQFSLDGEFLDEYTSVKEAAEKTGIVKQNISSNLTGKYKTAGGFLWRYKDPLLTLQGHLKKSFEMPKHSEETKKKMSSSAKKGEDHHMKNKTGVNNPRSKKIIQKSLEGDEIKVWNSMSDINRELGFTPSNICRCCQGSVKRIGGFRWEYYIQ